MATNPGIANLVEWWDLDETSGDRAGSHASKTLTDASSVGYTTGVVGNAAVFVGSSSDRLSRLDEADLRTGDIDFTWVFWVNPTSLAADDFYISKLNSGTDLDYYIKYDQSDDEFQFFVEGGGTVVSVGASTFGSPSTSTWYMLSCYHDSTANVIGISVNAGTRDTQSTGATTLDASSGNFFLGRAGGTYADCYLDEVAFFKETLTTDDEDWLYNSGDGRTYSDIILQFVEVAGAITPAGTLVKKTSKIFAGAITFAGSLIKKTLKVLSGTFTSSGVVATAKKMFVAVSGAITFSGSLVKKIFKNFAGSITPTGTVLKKMYKAYSGAITFSGTAIKKTILAFSGTITLGGSLLKKTKKVLAGTITFIGTAFASLLKVIHLFLERRITKFNLEKRDTDYTLEERDTHMSIEERNTEFTLEERDTQLVRRKRE